MCRLFGFRSVIPSQVHRSLISADNALGPQSDRHPDGWGVAYYVDGAPHVTRSPTTALNCALFRRVSGVVSSETVLAHVRKATQGEPSVLNCHPFQHGRWTFAHNGDIPEFAREREALVARIAPRLRRFILGDTDSEVVFYLFLSELERRGSLSAPSGAEEVAAALGATVALVRGVARERALLTFIVTDGVTMAAHQGGKELFFSTYKTRCGDRDTCPSLAPECEAPTESGFVHHLLFSSEPIHGENVWLPLEEGEIVAVDGRMRLLRTTADRRALPVVAASVSG
jgi:glutamine amidotransferase